MARAVGLPTALNHVVAAVAVRRKPSRAFSWPRFLQVEVSSRCNMACSQCARSTLGSPSRQGLMPLDLFGRVLDQFRHVEGLTLHGLGEPLLNPGVPDMVRMARARFPSCRIGLSTNGLLLTPDRAKALTEAGLDEIGVSLDAATGPTHATVRGGGFEGIVRNLADVCAAEDRPAVALSLVVMEPNVRELVGFVELGARLGVDRVSLCDLSARWKPEGEDPMAIRSIDEARAQASAAEERARDLGVPFAYTKLDRLVWPEAFIPCFYLWDYPYVTWEGLVTPCCALPWSEAALGDLTRESFWDVWRGPTYRRMRRGLVRGPVPATCRGCHHAVPA